MSPRELIEIESWYFRAHRRFVWDKETIADYVEPLKEAVLQVITDNHYARESGKSLTTPEIGIFRITDRDNPEDVFGYALYISDAKVSEASTASTVFAQFKKWYKVVIGADEFSWPYRNETLLREHFPDRADMIIKETKERAKLVKNFRTLANKSLNHRRSTSPRVRYIVLERDNFTCQLCGRRPPEITLHIDHISPVSWENAWDGSDDPSDYQVLCEACNIGKGDLSWMQG